MPSLNPILPVTIKQPYSKPNSYLDPPDPMLLQQEIFNFDDPTGNFLVSSQFDEEKETNFSISKPLLSRTSSFAGISSVSSATTVVNSEQRRRRIASESSIPSLLDDVSGSDGGGDATPRGQSIGQEVGHAAAETFLVTRLSLKLLSYLGVGYKWMVRFMALGCYSFMLLPGFIQVGYYYFFSKQVLRSIVYGDQPRNRLDLYLPKDIDRPKPVVAFVTGGAWIIGYKAWGSLLGKQLSERDIIVACIDYRNFPQGTMSDMVSDASQGISFVCNNIAQYGGDPNRIYLMGQSAGAHIAACALVDQAIKEATTRETITWNVSQIKAYFGLSGGYNLYNLIDYFHGRGLYKSVFLSIMEGEESLQRFSPEVIVQDPNLKDAVSLLPPIILFHGSADYSIPADASKNFAGTLQRVGVRAESILYEGKTHTDVFLQDPMRGGKDQMFEDLVAIIHANDPEAQAKDAVAPPKRRLVPEFMIQIARKVSPF
ncbi:isoprenylcysteine alpha-carbonyl methylesterase ICME-like isoform X1 [Mercurialis annua]|uniref:isoprenylcysteine alpha-carbonyl methylesterase ICME-like isoform X1 n=1 Tax=Mercurialis annua TaxID=3986 RepID=UPI002160B68A|nr:isoprenylcysteine alpha-carbonyl methylesterase ICME-like isoform X1 [Mercurialis annua]